jgi:hypothetical protein
MTGVPSCARGKPDHRPEALSVAVVIAIEFARTYADAIALNLADLLRKNSLFTPQVGVTSAHTIVKAVIKNLHVKPVHVGADE